MSIAGERRPLDVDDLIPGRRYVVPLLIRSLVGETVALSTAPGVHPIDAPKGIARLVDLDALLGVRIEDHRIDIAPGDNWLTMQLHVGDEVVATQGYRVHVPDPGNDNATFIVRRVPKP